MNFLNANRGVWSWLTTIDHKRIAMMYLVSVIFVLPEGGILAMACRSSSPARPTMMGANTYNRMLTLHGVVMIFLFMIPAIAGVFGNFLLPLMLGAKDVTFPRLNLLSLYLYWTGATLALSGVIMGGTDTGWTFYAPYRADHADDTRCQCSWALHPWFLVDSHRAQLHRHHPHVARAPDELDAAAAFGLGDLSTSIIQVLATPVIGLTLLWWGSRRWAASASSIPSRGGDPVLFRHMFWFYSGPPFMVLPAMGVVCDAVSAFARKNIFSYELMAYSSLGSLRRLLCLGAPPVRLRSSSSRQRRLRRDLDVGRRLHRHQGVRLGGAALPGRQINTPLNLHLQLLFFVVFGGMTGIAVATVSLDVHWHDTYFVIAIPLPHGGAVIMAFLVALHYWFPKGWAACTTRDGRWWPPRSSCWDSTPPSSRSSCWERRHAASLLHVSGTFQALNVASTAGASLLAMGVRRHPHLPHLRAGAVRWRGTIPGIRGATKWANTSPPPKHNFDQTPIITQDSHMYQEPGEEVEHVVI